MSFNVELVGLCVVLLVGLTVLTRVVDFEVVCCILDSLFDAIVGLAVDVLCVVNLVVVVLCIVDLVGIVLVEAGLVDELPADVDGLKVVVVILLAIASEQSLL